MAPLPFRLTETLNQTILPAIRYSHIVIRYVCLVFADLDEFFWNNIRL